MGGVTIRALPWFDGAAALTAGTAVLLVRGALVELEGLPPHFVTFMGVVNLAYALPGLTLGALRRRPPWLLRLLIVANLVWSVVCVVIANRVWPTASVLGLAHLLGEGLFVAVLALAEARYTREILAVDQ